MKRRLALFPVLAVALTAAAAAPADLTLALREKVIKDLSSSGLVLAFHIGVTNASASPRELVRYHYRVRIIQIEYLNMTVSLETPLTLPPERETLVALPVKISYDNLRAAIGPVEGQAPCDVVGEMFFRNERGKEQKVLFAFSGEFPIFQDPEVDILPLKVNDLTVGGADVVFRPRFKNFNGYELIVDLVEFELYFAGHQVLVGPIPGDKSLPGTGEKIFSLPFLLDFFEAGEEVREAFAKEEFSCRFTGRIEIASVWGRLHIRFDKTQNVRLEKAPGPQNQ
ncbi:MAG TPA: LEA type 2 family protein [Acidobacteriota bacterium]|nr:LEA type 2 family protein [Acidobacteriota bacterium]